MVRLLEDQVPVALFELVDQGEVETSRIVSHRCGAAMRLVATNLFARGLNGPLRRMMMEGAVLQLLAMQAAAAVGKRSARRQRALAAHERDAVHEALRRLLADMCAPPTLGALAAAVGLSEKRLNVGFRELFGGTVYEVLHNERLAHANIALQSGGVLLKEVAFRVGYNHVTNFISAFTQRYGAPPRQYLHLTSRDRTTEPIPVANRRVEMNSPAIDECPPMSDHRWSQAAKSPTFDG